MNRRTKLSDKTIFRAPAFKRCATRRLGLICLLRSPQILSTKRASSLDVAKQLLIRRFPALPYRFPEQPSSDPIHFLPWTAGRIVIQIADNLNWVIGNHTTKFGADFNFINIDATFELNFPGLFNFSSFNLQPVITGSACQRTAAHAHSVLRPGHSRACSFRASAIRKARSRIAR